MTLKPVYKPPLHSESDTQFFSKEFTQMQVLNPEDPQIGQTDSSSNGDLPAQMMDIDLECLYNNVHTADEADN